MEGNTKIQVQKTSKEGTIKNNNFIYAIYVGHKNGNFYEIINLDINKKLKRKYKVDLKTKWLVIKIATENGQRIQYEDFLDHNFNKIKQTKNVQAIAN